MAEPRVANWVAETTSTDDTGPLDLTGAIQGFIPFSTMGDGLVYYTIQEGFDKEIGIGTLDAQANTLERTTVVATLINNRYSTNGQPMPLKGYAEVYCTIQADFISKFYEFMTTSANDIQDLKNAMGSFTAAGISLDNTFNSNAPDNVQDAIEYLWTKKNSNIAVPSAGTGYDLDVGQYTSFDITLDQPSCTIGITNDNLASNSVNQVIVVLRQDSTGTRKVVWDQSIKWPGNQSPVMTFTPDKTDAFVLTRVGSSGSWLGSTIGTMYD